MTPTPDSPSTDRSPAQLREIRYVASDNFVPLLERLQASLLVSTYHAGRVVTLGVHNGQLICEFHSFELAMGLALNASQLAVGTRHDVVLLRGEPHLAPTLAPAGRYDACRLTQQSIHTGTIAIHEMAFVQDELWVVNTLFSCLATLDNRYHFVPRWKPGFISALQGPEDRCHLNGMAIEQADGSSRVRFVTCLGMSDEPQGWRANKATGGVILDVPSQQVVSHGLCMPHSPRLHNGKLWVLDSGRAALQIVDRVTGQRTTVERFPGYPRGLAFYGPLAVVALSRIRETSVFGGIPIAEHRESLKCGLAIVDCERGRTLATFEFSQGVEELFDVQFVPGVRCLALRGPHPPVDDHAPVWVVPPLRS